MRLKKQVANTTLGLEQLKQIRVVDYDWIDDSERPADYDPDRLLRKGRQTGLIAQEVGHDLIPGMVKTDQWGYEEMSSNHLIFPLVRAVQQLSAQVDELRASCSTGCPS